MVLIDIHGVPPQLCKETKISRAIAAFGVYLGTVDQDLSEDLAVWTAAVATEPLERVPHQIIFVDSGIETPAIVQAKTWYEMPLYGREDLPRPTKEYTSPPCRAPPSDTSSGNETTPKEEETVLLPVRILRQIYKNYDLNTIPTELREEWDKLSPAISAMEGDTSRVHETQATKNQEVVREKATISIDRVEDAGHFVFQSAAPQTITHSKPRRILVRRKQDNQTATDCIGTQTDSLPLRDTATHAGEGSRYKPRTTHHVFSMQGQRRLSRGAAGIARGTSRWARFNAKGRPNGPIGAGPKTLLRSRRKTTQNVTNGKGPNSIALVTYERRK